MTDRSPVPAEWLSCARLPDTHATPTSMSDDSDLFDTPDTFEGMSHDNGEPYWWQSDLQVLLGYKDARSFKNAAGRAIQAMNQLGVPIQDNFHHVNRDTDGGGRADDCKLSRFACYLTAMNADPKKPEVARAQAYFATLAEVARQYIQETEGVERVLVRGEISDQESTLASTAKTAGIQQYPFFQNAGYRGLYNMNLKAIKGLKGVPEKRSVLDFMGREELAANLFRITQTEAQIRSENAYGQRALESTAQRVGKKVREAIEEIGGTMPEHLNVAEDIREVKKGLKKAQCALQDVDKQKRLSRGDADASE